MPVSLSRHPPAPRGATPARRPRPWPAPPPPPPHRPTEHARAADGARARAPARLKGPPPSSPRPAPRAAPANTRSAGWAGQSWSRLGGEPPPSPLRLVPAGRLNRRLDFSGCPTSSGAAVRQLLFEAPGGLGIGNPQQAAFRRDPPPAPAFVAASERFLCSWFPCRPSLHSHSPQFCDSELLSRFLGPTLCFSLSPCVTPLLGVGPLGRLTHSWPFNACTGYKAKVQHSKPKILFLCVHFCDN